MKSILKDKTMADSPVLFHTKECVSVEQISSCFAFVLKSCYYSTSLSMNHSVMLNKFPRVSKYYLPLS